LNSFTASIVSANFASAAAFRDTLVDDDQLAECPLFNMGP
jgi:hypothetical protein